MAGNDIEGVDVFRHNRQQGAGVLSSFKSCILSRKVDSVEEIDETVLVNIGTRTDFKKLIEKNYQDVVWDGDWGKIERQGCSIEFSLRDEPFSKHQFVR